MPKLFNSFSRVLIIVLIIKVFDIVKSLIIASKLGVSNMSDIFMSIMIIPDGLIVMLGLDSLKGVINSEYSKIYVKENSDYLWKSFSNLFLIVTTAGVILNILIYLFRIEIISIFLPGFEDSKKFIAVNLAIIIFPVFIFKVMAGMIHSVLNSVKRFNFPIAVNVIATIALIISVFLPYLYDNILYNLSLAILFSNILIFILSYFYIIKFGGKLNFSFFHFDPNTKKIFKNCLKIFPLVICDQMFNFSKNFFASFQGEGAISSLNYAKSIPNLIITLIFTTIFSILLTNLSSSFETEKRIQTRKIFTDTLISVFYICAPFVIIFILNGEIILKLFYLRGNFNINGISKTLSPFYWESLSVLSFIMFMLPTALFLAKKEYKYLNLIGSLIYISGIFINYLFSNYWGYYGLSISNFFVTLVYGVLLINNSRRFFGNFLKELLPIIRICISCFLTLVITYLISELYTKIESDLFFEVISLCFKSLLVLILYYFTCKTLKVNYLMTIKKYF